jgi:hypothetical protein
LRLFKAASVRPLLRFKTPLFIGFVQFQSHFRFGFALVARFSIRLSGLIGDHRVSKKRVWLARGYQSFSTAWRTLQGTEAVHMIRNTRPTAVYPSYLGLTIWRRLFQARVGARASPSFRNYTKGSHVDPEWRDRLGSEGIERLSAKSSGTI